MTNEKAITKLEKLETHCIKRLAECQSNIQELKENVKNEELKYELIAYWIRRIDEISRFLTVLMDGRNDI